MYENLHKEPKNKDSRNGSRKKNTPLRPKEENPKSDEVNMMKPNVMKKKPKATDESRDEIDNERVWKEEEAKRLEEERRREEERKKEEEKKRQEAAAAAEENAKKPFTLKKNRLKSSEPPKPLEESPVAKVSEPAAPSLSLDLAPEPK